MGWVSYVEDIKRRFEELDDLVQGIESGSIPYTDTVRGRLSDISRHLRVRIANLERTLRQLGPDDKKLIEDVVESGEKVEDITREKERIENELKKAYEQVGKFKDERDDHRQRFEYVARLFIDKSGLALRHYLIQIGYK